MATTSLKSHFETATETKPPSSVEREIGKQGLRKQILRKGTSWQTPLLGDEVQVHFSGHIDGGACLASSRDTGTPFCFKLGQGEVIKGWDEGVATMKKGERAIFFIPPVLAYGDSGSPPLIPPNSSLVFDIELLSWSTIRDITGDGGILKKIIKEGEGWATPRDNDEVLVKYEARLQNGPLVSESNEGVEFRVFDGHLCPAISKAVRTMRRGEKAELVVKFSYGIENDGYEATNIEGAVSSVSNLTIQLELLSWKSVVDVTGDQKVLKKIKKAGQGFDRPNEGSLVKVIYIGRLEDGAVFETKGTNEEPFEFTTLEENVNEGLERAIMTMKKEEQATVTISAEYLCGHEVSELVCANSVLYYEVTLIDFTKEKPFWKMDTHEKIEACERKKHDGNLLFRAGKYWRASKKYEKKHQANGLRLSCYLNNAACKLKLEDYSEASSLCTKVLELEPLNVKALFRRSQAYLKTSELEKDEADIKRALTIDPNNRDVKLVYMELKENQREYAKYQAEIFGSMLSKMG
ncbi:peptidyl-prolyl cis-trans isomerase FKBP65 [Citrus sinensis]|uniref:Peptidyl-prolyl cis-trans isomerase FKBP65 n=1 Tax=Citrus sinensis TaxID=2711 RepID=A0ACB8K1N0_CITSI|nr:peptidyl-prolyl cis-trans isomerase FKBP65 [Citrus sinensis]